MFLATVLLALLCSLSAFAQYPGGDDLRCVTISAYGYGKRAGLPTTTSTRTLKPTTITVVRTKTVRTRTTLPATVTIVVVTKTETETSVATETSTVPAPPGFIPVTQSSGYTSANTPGQKRRAVREQLLGRRQSSAAVRYPKGYSPKSRPTYPKPRYVKCITTIQKTKYVGSVTTSTSTITIAPTVTSTSTTTTTETTVSTMTVPFYAGCADANILGPVANPPGQYVQGVGNSDPSGVQANFGAGSAYDCCVDCLNSLTVSNCQNAIYDANTGICNPLGGNPAACGAGGTQGNIGSYVLLTTSPNNRYDINGPCGVLGPDPAA